MSDEIETELLDYLTRTFLAEEPDFGLEVHESLLDAEVLDSLAMFDVAEHLERTYGITVGDEDITVDNFETVGAIATMVRTKLGSRA